VVEKVTYNTADNPNFDAVLRSLGHRQAVVFGVATEFCVRASALALRERGQAVDLVRDCIQGITEDGANKALREMAESGVRMVTTDEVVAALR
jgi:nicotinamidase/pyrazinamidase